MALEIFSFLASLVSSNPAENDRKQRGDDHIRGIKTALLKSFAGFPGAVMISGVDVGVSNTYVLSPSEPLTEYSTRMIVTFLPATTNGGSSTLNISGLGPKTIKSVSGAVLNNGDIMAGNPLVLVFDGTDFRMTAPTKNYIDQLITTGAFPVNPGDAGKPLLANSTGTAASFSADLGVALNEKRGANIASATTVNLTTATGNFVHITGVTTITGVTLADGASRTVVFDGALTLTHSANLVLPSGANIVTAAGDVATLRGEAGGVVRVVHYERASGHAVVEPISPGLVLLATVDLSIPGVPVAAIDFLNVFTSSFDDYLVLCGDLTFSGAAITIDMRIAVGGVLDAGSNYGSALPNTSVSGSNNFIFATGGNAGVGSVNSLVLRFMRVNSTSQQVYTDSVSATPTSYVTGTRNGAHFGGPASGFRLYVNGAGTFNPTGSIRVYGYKKA